VEADGILRQQPGHGVVQIVEAVTPLREKFTPELLLSIVWLNRGIFG
jgi:hypothetical protein